jgi:hypothetical protein
MGVRVSVLLFSGLCDFSLLFFAGMHLTVLLASRILETGE